MMKKVWEKPELVVLVRSKPEEGVLAGCKDVGLSNWPGGYFNGCEFQWEVLCGACLIYVTS